MGRHDQEGRHFLRNFRGDAHKNASDKAAENDLEYVKTSSKKVSGQKKVKKPMLATYRKGVDTAFDPILPEPASDEERDLTLAGKSRAADSNKEYIHYQTTKKPSFFRRFSGINLHKNIGHINKKAGRDLSGAILVGVGILAILLIGLFIWKPLLLITVIVFIALGVGELYAAFKSKGSGFSFIPVIVASVLLPIVAYFGTLQGLLTALAVCIVVIILWSCLEHKIKHWSIGVGVFVVVWVGFLISFVFLIYGDGKDSLEEGNLKLLLVLITVVASDTGAYFVGLKWGKTPMAPKVSPKKSWEGFAGGTIAAMLVGTVYCFFMMDVTWVFGLIFGFCIATAATFGDLTESMVKRELGVKDMSTILPGHGGVMDRLDSFLFAVPVSWALFVFVLPLFVA